MNARFNSAMVQHGHGRHVNHAVQPPSSQAVLDARLTVVTCRRIKSVFLIKHLQRQQL